MKPLTFNDFITGLEQNKPYSFARYGDGEMLPCMNLRVNSYNADRTKLTKQLGNELRQVIRNDYPYWHGLLAIARKECNQQDIENFLSSNTSMKNWYNGDCLLDAMLKGYFKPFIEQMRKRSIVYVGGKHLSGLKNDFFKYRYFIPVNERNSYRQRKQVFEQLFAVLEEVDFIGYSAGPLSNLLIDDIFAIRPDIFQIDFGSSFDGYFGVINRSYARKLNWDDLKRKNIL